MMVREGVRRVVIAVDRNPEYAFLLPLSAQVWIAAGWTPLALLIGDEATWREDRTASVALDALRSLGVSPWFVDAPRGFRSSTASQFVRCVASALPLDEDDYLLTTDVDLWPLRPEWYRASGGALQLYFADAYEHARYAMCCLGASVRTWREITGMSSGLDAALARTLELELGRASSADRAWNFDEEWLSRRIRRWDGYPDRCDFVERRGRAGLGRVDRSAWPDEPIRLEAVVDAHLPRDAFGSNWPRVRSLLQALMPGAVTEADAYREAFVRART